MAFARVQGNSGYGVVTDTTIAVTISAVGSGNCICGVVAWTHATNTVTSVTDNQGNTYNLETQADDTPNTSHSAAFSRTNITNGPVTITANISGTGAGFRKIIVDEFSGGSTASSDERDSTAHGGQYQAAPGTGTDAITSGTFTTVQNGDLLYGTTTNHNSTHVATTGTSFSTGTAENTDYTILTEYRVQVTAGSGTAATFTQVNANPRTTFLVAIKAPSVAETAQPLAFAVHQGGGRMIIRPIGY
jgi:hypothetical protein